MAPIPSKRSAGITDTDTDTDALYRQKQLMYIFGGSDRHPLSLRWSAIASVVSRTCPPWLLLLASLSHVTAWQSRVGEEEKEEEQSVQHRCERSSVCKDMSSLRWNRCKLAPTERLEQLNPPYRSNHAGIDLLSFERIIKEALLSTVHEILDQLVQFVYRLSRGVYDATSTLQNYFTARRGS